ncbi:unnamed protein product [Diabrotica balteata]|uniref:BTB domain-containing protein n=1 Tax=Diabrotica balteata TaxID=107213 RepID=A0A9N9XCS3_DIABA|nr:unnamed protein product [Diabrotica balteata]
MRLKKSKIRHVKQQMLDKLKLTKPAVYDPEFKKTVVSFAEKKGNKEARRLYGVPEYNIRRWRGKTRHYGQPPEIPEIVPKIEPKQEVDTLDSMPLQQRLKNPASSTPPPESPEQVLQSQPLSPTKLKVTRHVKPSAPSPVQLPPPPPTPPIEEVCLRWNSHHSNMQTTFPTLLLREQYVDATLVAEGQTLKCHRVILSSCSPYFEEVLASISPYQHPVLFMKDVPFWTLKCICDFMYSGEIHIIQTKLDELLAIAETLKIKGLAGQKDAQTVDTKPDLTIPIKEEKNDEKEVKKKDEVKKKEEKEIKRKDEKEIKKKEEKEVKKKDEKELKKKEEKEIKRKDEKEIKKKEEKEIKKKEEKEIKKKEEKEIKKKEEKEIKKKDEKEFKKKEEVKVPEIKPAKRKEDKEIKKKDEKEAKKKEEIKEVKEKKRTLSTPPPETPALKNRKVPKLVLHGNIPVLKSFGIRARNRSGGISRRSEKKLEKEKTPVSEKQQKIPITKDSPGPSFSNPYDLLKPVYEEVAKNLDPKPAKVVPTKETVRRTLQKKLKKRKISDTREESPPPSSSRKGRRRKVPKYSHPNPLANFDQSTIVREPHTDQAESFLQMQAIKSEPLYDDSIEIEDNLVGFSETSVSVEEKLIGSFGRRSTRRSKQHIIMDVNKIASKKEEPTLKIVNVAELQTATDPLEDPLGLNQSSSDSTAIVENADNNLGFRISQVITEKEDSQSSDVCREMGFQISSIVSEHDKDNKMDDEVTTKIEAPDEEEEVFNDFEDSTSQPEDQKPIIFPIIDEVDKKSENICQAVDQSDNANLSREISKEGITESMSTTQEYNLDNTTDITFKIKTELLTETENEPEISPEEEDGILNAFDDETDEVEDHSTNPMELGHESEQSMDHADEIVTASNASLESEMTTQIRVVESVEQVVSHSKCSDPVGVLTDESRSQQSLNETTLDNLRNSEVTESTAEISTYATIGTNNESVVNNEESASFLPLGTVSLSANQLTLQDSLTSPKPSEFSLTNDDEKHSYVANTEVDPLNEDHLMDDDFNDDSNQINETNDFAKSPQTINENLEKDSDIIEPNIAPLSGCSSTQHSIDNSVEISLDLGSDKLEDMPQPTDGNLETLEELQAPEVSPSCANLPMEEDFINENEEVANEIKSIDDISVAQENTHVEENRVNSPKDNSLINSDLDKEISIPDSSNDLQFNENLNEESRTDTPQENPQIDQQLDLNKEETSQVEEYQDKEITPVDSGNTSPINVNDTQNKENIGNEASGFDISESNNENQQIDYQENSINLLQIESDRQSLHSQPQKEEECLDLNQQILSTENDQMEEEYDKDYLRSPQGASNQENLNVSQENQMMEEEYDQEMLQGDFGNDSAPQENQLLMDEDKPPDVNQVPLVDDSSSMAMDYEEENNAIEEPVTTLEENKMNFNQGDSSNIPQYGTTESMQEDENKINLNPSHSTNIPQNNVSESMQEDEHKINFNQSHSSNIPQYDVTESMQEDENQINFSESHSSNISQYHMPESMQEDPTNIDGSVTNENSLNSEMLDENIELNTPIIEKCDISNMPESLPHDYIENKALDESSSNVPLLNEPLFSTSTGDDEMDTNIIPYEEHQEKIMSINDGIESSVYGSDPIILTQPDMPSFEVSQSDKETDNTSPVVESYLQNQQSFNQIQTDEAIGSGVTALDTLVQETDNTSPAVEPYLQNQQSFNQIQTDEASGSSVTALDTLVQETDNTSPVVEPYLQNQQTFNQIQTESFPTDEAIGSNEPDFPTAHEVNEQSSSIEPDFQIASEVNEQISSNHPEFQIAPEINEQSSSNEPDFQIAHVVNEQSSSNDPAFTNEVSTLNEPDLHTAQEVNEESSSNDPALRNEVITLNEPDFHTAHELTEQNSSDEQDFQITRLVNEQSSSNDPDFSGAQGANEPGFHIAQVVNEQIAEIEGIRDKRQFVGDNSDMNERCEKVNTSNDFESIVNDLSQIVGDSCGVTDLPLTDDTNSIADSLENLLQK